MPGRQPARRSRGPGHAKIAGRFLLSARWVVPVEPAGAVLEHHAVAIRDGLIEAVVPAKAGTPFSDYAHIDLPDHVLIPGLVNAHTRAATSLLRGLGPPTWPKELRHLSDRFVRDGTALACAEMLRGGVTCFSDMYFFPEAALEAAAEAGMRAMLGLVVADVATPYASDPADYLSKGLAVRDRNGEQALVSFCLASQSPAALGDEILRKVGTLAAELDLPVQLDLRRSEAQIERLQRLGLLGPGLGAVHAAGLTDAELALLGREGCSIVHCPSSELAQASGVARVQPMLKSGINVALGTGGVPDTHRLDLFAEMRIAGLPAHAALHAATLGGARALGLGGRIGSIEPGKSADLAAVALRAPELAPRYDPVSNLVYAAGREHVTHVWVGGELRVSDGALLNDVSGLDTRWQIWQNSLAAS